MLGKAECGECGGVKVLEVDSEGMIKSRCLTCGFVENEWLYGDNPDYLDYLAEHYGVTVEEIKQALRPHTQRITQIQYTIVNQLKTLNPYFQKLYGVKDIIAIDDGRTVRLHTRNKGVVINIDIIYHRVPDCYELKAYAVSGTYTEELKDAHRNMVYFDQLDDLIHRTLHKYAKVPYNIVEG